MSVNLNEELKSLSNEIKLLKTESTTFDILLTDWTEDKVVEVSKTVAEYKTRVFIRHNIIEVKRQLRSIEPLLQQLLLGINELENILNGAKVDNK